jgi:hypothetical protein
MQNGVRWKTDEIIPASVFSNLLTSINAVIGNLWGGATVPSGKVVEDVLNTALANATSPGDVSARMITSFTRLGFPAAGGR